MGSQDTKRRWHFLPPPPPGFSARFPDLPPLWAHLLYTRGVRTSEEANSFTHPERQPLHDPYLLPDMDQAVDRLLRAHDAGEWVAIFGDFDTDGVTATALLAEALSSQRFQVVPYIPHRVEEGHGLNLSALQELQQRGTTLLITVDCGVTSHQEVTWATSNGLDVIITDHHAPPPTLPPAIAVVDAARPESRYPFPHLAGVGMAFKLVQALYQRLGQPWPETLLELVALGTIADLAPMTGENRTLVWRGLRELSATRRPGLQALLALANVDPDEIDTEAVSFALAPRLNAAGRMEHASPSYNLLVTQDPVGAQTLAEELDRYNTQRRELTAQVLTEVRRTLPPEPTTPLLIAAGDGYPQGVLGLVASRLVEEWYRPAVVIALGTDGVSHGSGRSIQEFNLVQALRQCGDLFLRVGGHPMAAGFEISTDSLGELRERLLTVAHQELEGVVLVPHLDIEAQVDLGTIQGKTYAFVQSLGPFGPGNPAPVFLSRGVQVANVRMMGASGEHLRLGLKRAGVLWNAVAFGQAQGWIPGTQRVDVVYTVGADTWAGQDTLRLRVLDYAPRPIS